MREGASFIIIHAIYYPHSPLHAPVFIVGQARERQDIIAAAVLSAPGVPFYPVTMEEEAQVLKRFDRSRPIHPGPAADHRATTAETRSPPQGVMSLTLRKERGPADNTADAVVEFETAGMIKSVPAAFRATTQVLKSADCSTL